jgi:hypothetical protein
VDDIECAMPKTVFDDGDEFVRQTSELADFDKDQFVDKCIRR